MPTKKQELLKQIRSTYCDDKTVRLAQAIGKDYSYVSRLFYPTEKKGHKGIGLEIMEACSRAFDLPNGFWDGSEGDGTPSAPRLEATHTRAARELPLNSPYARLLANTFDTLAMDPVAAKAAFLAATQVLIDHAAQGSHPATAGQARAGVSASTLLPGQSTVKNAP